MKARERRGFTLVELLVVIAIIGILASIVLASLNNARAKGRDAKRVADVNQLRLALELYFDANSSYPTGDGTVAATLAALTTSGYISVLPSDPSASPAAYGYVALPSGCDNSATTCNSYVVATQLESSNTAFSSSYQASQAVTVNGVAHNCNQFASPDFIYCVKP